MATVGRSLPAPIDRDVFYRVVLTLSGGRTRRSVPLESPGLADTVGRLSLLDAGVQSYRVVWFTREGGGGAAPALEA
jgi:hypothetical protein